MTSAFLHATNPGMNRHTHSTSTPSTVRSLVTLGWQRGREGGAGGHLQTFSLLETDHYDADYHTVFVVLFSLVKCISVSGWGHLRNGSRSVASWLLWIRCCTTVSGLNWWQLRQTRKERFSCVNLQLVQLLLACAWVFVCLVHGLPAADSSGHVCWLCPAAVVCPGPLVVVPRQTQAALHCESVAHLFTQVLVSGGFPKIGIQQGQVSHPCSYHLYALVTPEPKVSKHANRPTVRQ